MNGAGAPSAIPAYLIAQARWLFWRNKTVTNKKTREKRTTKAPFSYRDGKQPCDAHNPRNWVSYDKIAAALARTPGAWDGAGFDLGIIEALGEVVIGLDLDTCLDADGRLAVWANDYLTAMPSYAEVSPSGTGIKIVARIRFADLPEARRLFGIPEGDKEQARTRVFGERTKGATHVPSAQLFLMRRYFTVTGKRWVTAPDDVALLNLDQIAALAALFGPKPAGAVRRASGRRQGTLGGLGEDGADEDAPPDEAALRDKLGAAFLRNPKLKERWEGGAQGLNDTTRSGRDFSVLALLVAADFSKAETHAALCLFEHGKVADEPARYFDQMWDRTSASPPPKPPKDWEAAHPGAGKGMGEPAPQPVRGDPAPQPADAVPPVPPPPPPPDGGSGGDDAGDEGGGDGDGDSGGGGDDESTGTGGDDGGDGSEGDNDDTGTRTGGDDDDGTDADDSGDGDGGGDAGERTGTGNDGDGDTNTDTGGNINTTNDTADDDDDGEEDEDGPGPEWIAAPDEIADEDRPPITVEKGLLHRLTDAAEQAIIASCIPVYHRGVLVRPAITKFDAADGGTTHIAILHPLTVPDMLDVFCRTANWRTWTAKKGYVAADPPTMVARILLGRVGQWRVPQVRGILSTPALRRDGSLLREPGYDKTSGYYLALPPDLHVPTISDSPSKGEALAAIRLLEALLVDFPFINDGGASKAVGLSLLICAVIRPAMIVAPIHAASAPAAGTGKSYLYDIAGAIAYGDRCPVVFAGKGPEELEKKLNGILLRGTSLFNLDNLNTPLEGDLLCQASERPLLDLRKLGKSDMFLTPNSALVGATANNLVVHDDLNRRTLLCSMDRNVERPELHDFKGANPVQTVLKDRGKYIAAVLTVVRAYLCDPVGVTVPPLASYDDYTRFVREPLWWLGRAEPAKTMDALAAADPVTSELLGVMSAWETAIGLNKPITTATIMRNLDHPPMPKREDFGGDSAKWTTACNAVRDAWNDLAATINAAAAPHGGKATAKNLGEWLGRHSKRITSGRRFVSQQGHASTKTWWLAAGK